MPRAAVKPASRKPRPAPRADSEPMAEPTVEQGAAITNGQLAQGPDLEPPAADEAEGKPARGASWVDRLEAFLSRLSTRDNFWQRVFSLLFLRLSRFGDDHTA